LNDRLCRIIGDIAVLCDDQKLACRPQVHHVAEKNRSDRDYEFAEDKDVPFFVKLAGRSQIHVAVSALFPHKALPCTSPGTQIDMLISAGLSLANSFGLANKERNVEMQPNLR
jgi:hypothetical protein